MVKEIKVSFNYGSKFIFAKLLTHHLSRDKILVKLSQKNYVVLIIFNFLR